MEYKQKIKKLVPPSAHPPLGKLARLLIKRPYRAEKQRRDLLKDSTLTAGDRELLRRVESRISAEDGMYTGNGAHYFQVGLSAIRCIDQAISAAGINSITRVLDLPCGYGRVLRFLTQRMPQASFTASDLIHDAVDFCSKVFGVEGVYSEIDPTNFSLEKQFDLIWCGSLVTHLDERGVRSLLTFFARHLSPGGLLIVTTHGAEAIRRMLNHEFDYGISPESVDPLIEATRQHGFGFVNYPGANGYGVSLTSPDWLRSHAEYLRLKEVFYRESGWDNHQDVYAWLSPSGVSFNG